MNNFENPKRERMIPDSEKLLEESKNPGLGLRKLHKQGVTGEGVLVAVIDQKLLMDHKEYKNKIESYSEYGKAKEENPSMHGSAVASLLVGETCGVAPGAKIDYRAIPSGRDFTNWANALKDIIEKNKKSEPDKKIKVVSCSIGYLENRPEPGLDEWIEVIKNAEKEGIIVVDTTERLKINFTGGGTDKDKDNFEEYNPWLNSKNKEETLNSIIVPSDYRTMASWKGENEYMYTGKGGLSWSVPYLSGLFTLALQVNPDLKQKEIVDMINQSTITNKKGLKIVNPKGIVELAKKSRVK